MAYQKLTRWIARVGGGVIGLLVLSGFALDFIDFGAAASRLSRMEQVHGVLLFVAAASLLVAWRHERLGGIIAVVAGVTLGAVYWISNEFRVFWPLGAVMAAPGVLFLVASRRTESSPEG